MNALSPCRACPPEATGLILTGGGARAAYQVGVLEAIMGLRAEVGHPHVAGNPFPIIAGTSAGAINGAALACGADDFPQAVRTLAETWSNFRAEHVYVADMPGVMGTAAKWLSMFARGWVMSRGHRVPPRSLLDNTPLASLIQRMIPMPRLPRLLRQGHMQALAISASSYTTGRHITFFQSADDQPNWSRSQRIAVRARLSWDHLLASSAIPFIFPAMCLPVQTPRESHDEFFGDGSMRQAAPISPAVHLGAQRVLVIGAGRMQEPTQPHMSAVEYPDLAQIAGHALSNIFLDALAVDIERLQRINHTLSLLPAAARAKTPLRPVEVLVIAPSQRLDDIAARHQGSLPRAVRVMLRAMGVSGQGVTARGSALASYLLFEPGYVQELMALGRSDVQAKRAEVLRFLA